MISAQLGTKHLKALRQGEVSREGFIEEVIFELSLEGGVGGRSKQKEKHEPVLEA